MLTKVTSTSKGQVAIPKGVRDYLGVTPGTAVTFDVAGDGRVTLARADGTPRPGLFLAGRAYRIHRGRGGTRTGVLPDFLTGAHAAVAVLLLLTRDVARHLAYFPTPTPIAPGA